MPPETNGNNKYVWYVGYGSNLFRKRFLCYIEGGQFELGGSNSRGCKDKTLPMKDKHIHIPYALYFAKNARTWDNQGVAFISTERDESKQTYGRMWKVTENQFSEICEQEGEWYNVEVDLGQDEYGIPIRTITNGVQLMPNKPSDKYLRTMILGLRETFRLDNESILRYLMEKRGIKGKMTQTEIIALF